MQTTPRFEAFKSVHILELLIPQTHGQMNVFHKLGKRCYKYYTQNVYSIFHF